MNEITQCTVLVHAPGLRIHVPTGIGNWGEFERVPPVEPNGFYLSLSLSCMSSACECLRHEMNMTDQNSHIASKDNQKMCIQAYFSPKVGVLSHGNGCKR